MDMEAPTKCGNSPIFGGLLLVYSSIYQLEYISVVMCLNAYTYLLRIYVLFDLFALALLSITNLNCSSFSFELSHQLNWTGRALVPPHVLV